MAEDHNPRAGAGPIFSTLEAATVQRAGAEDLERICGDSRPMPTRSGWASPVQVDLSAIPRGDATKAAHALPIVLDLDRRDPRLVPAGPAAPDHDASVGVGIRQRREENASHDTKHRRRRTHAEGEGEDGHGREAGLTHQPADTVPDVLTEKVHAPIVLNS